MITLTTPRNLQADIAFIGGSGTFSIRFPEDLNTPGIDVIADGLVVDTPFGPSPQLKIFALPGSPARRVITCKMHGRQPGVPWGQASQRLFWAFRAAGVRQIIAEGGVGSINHLLDPKDIVVVNDYIDQSLRKDVSLGEGYLLMMRQAICPDLHQALVQTARQHWQPSFTQGAGRVFDRGIYLVTEGRHFESPAEIAAFRMMGADVVGQTLCPEVYLARELGACFAGIYLVVNYGEGVVKPWDHQVLKDLFFEEAYPFARLILAALEQLPVPGQCGCQDLRKPTMLKPENIGAGTVPATVKEASPVEN